MATATDHGEAGFRRMFTAFAIRFVAVLAIGQFAYHGLLRPHRLFVDYLSALAAVAAAVLRLLGATVVTDGPLVSGTSFAFRIVTDCDAVDPILVLVAGVLAYPAPWRWRLAAALGGAGVIAAINVVRIVSLFAIGSRWPAAFAPLHEGVWQPAMLLASLGAWLAFVRHARRWRTA